MQNRISHSRDKSQKEITQTTMGKYVYITSQQGANKENNKI